MRLPYALKVKVLQDIRVDEREMSTPRPKGDRAVIEIIILQIK